MVEYIYIYIYIYITSKIEALVRWALFVNGSRQYCCLFGRILNYGL